jgi:hypothetical protein
LKMITIGPIVRLQTYSARVIEYWTILSKTIQ